MGQNVFGAAARYGAGGARGIEAHGEVGAVLGALLEHGVANDGDAGRVVGGIVEHAAVVEGAGVEDDGGVGGRGGDVGRVAVHAEAEVVFGAGRGGAYQPLHAQSQGAPAVVSHAQIELQDTLLVAAHHGNVGGTAQDDALQLPGLGRAGQAEHSRE